MVGFQFMLILGLLGMYFDAAVVFVTKSSLLFRLAVAILWKGTKKTRCHFHERKKKRIETNNQKRNMISLF
jgi:hypothetical protein